MEMLFFVEIMGCIFFFILIFNFEVGKVLFKKINIYIYECVGGCVDMGV